MSDSQDVGRRDFIKIVVALGGTIIAGTIALPGIAYLLHPAAQKAESEAWIELGPVSNFPPGTPTLVNFTRSRINGWERTVNSYGVYILNRESEGFLALSNICTHLNCRVVWNSGDTLYECPCHDGDFNIDGFVVKGPPPKPLNRYETKVENDIVFIHYVEG